MKNPSGQASPAKIGHDVAVYDTDAFPARKEGRNLCETRANIIAASRDPDAPLATVLVTAYNRIEKTRLCLESILRYTKETDYELLLFDHGSTDGTFDYFQSLKHPRKKVVRFSRNTTKLLPEALNLRCKYIVGLGNDVVVTQNWLSNLIACAESDPRIGVIVPLSSNVSNFQEVDLQFADLDDMQRKAAAFNVSDPKKWHERLRLVMPLYFVKKECFDLAGLGDYGIGQFMDDDWVFNIRRAGYRAMLCKDTFVHHNHDFRKGEDKDPREFAESLQKGRENFKQKHYGIDAWDDVNNYEPDMAGMIKQPAVGGDVEILGIDVRCGTPILEIKNKLREFGVFSARLSALSQDAKYYLDLKTICEGEVVCARAHHLSDYFDPGRFDYVVLGTPLNTYDHPVRFLTAMIKALKNQGQLFIRLRNTFDVCTMANILGNNDNFYDNCPVHLPVRTIQQAIYPIGGIIKEVRVESHQVENGLVGQFTEIVQKAKLTNNVNETMIKLFAESYLLHIVRAQ